MNGIHQANRRLPMIKKEISRIKKDDYQKYADCIQMEQLAAPEINELFEDEKFHNWYKRKYHNPYFR